MRFPFAKDQRVVRGAEFSRALRHGKHAANGTLVVFAVRSSDAGLPPRLGVTIPKKTGNAIVRNRWKRLIREAFRTQQHDLPGGYYFVIRPKKDAEPDWPTIRDSLPNLAGKAISRFK